MHDHHFFFLLVDAEHVAREAIAVSGYRDYVPRLVSMLSESLADG